MKKIAIISSENQMRTFAERRANRVAAKAELESRVASIESGSTKLLSLEEVKAALAGLDD